MAYFGPQVMAAGVILLAGAGLAPWAERRRPGAGWAELDNPDLSLAVINLAGNVAVFVPLGFCLRMALRRTRRPTLAALLLGAAVSVPAELLQLATGTRTTDVDDVLLNVLGVVIGVALGLCPASRSAGRMAGCRPRAAQDH